MEEIVSTLGFSCESALDSLARLASALEKADAVMQTFAKTVAGFDGSKLDNIGKGLASGLDVAAKSARTVELGLGSIARIAASRLISQGLISGRDALESMVSSAMELQTQLAKTSLFSGDMGVTQLQSAVKGVAESMGFTLSQTAEGLDKAFRVTGNSADAMTVFHASTDLAKASLSDLDKTTEAVGGALKAFGWDASRAGEMASKLQLASQDSKTQISELASGFGRVGPLARSLGVSLEEVLTTITEAVQHGASSSQAIMGMTQNMRNAAKPTADLTQLMHSLGFESTTAMIAAKGWGGYLSAIRDQTDQTAEGMLRILPAGRGTNQMFLLGAAGLDEYSRQLERFKSVSSSYAHDSALKALETDAQKVTVAWARLKSTMTTDLGNTIVSAIASGSSSIDYFVAGLKTISETATAAMPLIIAYTLAWTTGLNSAAAAGSTLSASLAGALQGVALAGTAYLGGKMIGSETIRAYDALYANVRAEEQKDLENFRAAEIQKLRVADEAIGSRIQKALAASDVASRQYEAELTAAQEAAKAEEKTVSDSLTRQLDARKHFLSAIEAAESKARTEIQSSQLRQETVQDQKSNLLFERSQADKSPEERIQAEISRGVALSREAAALLADGAKSNDDRMIARAGKLFEESQRMESQAASQAKSGRLLDLENTAQGTALRLLDDRIAAESSLQSIAAKRIAALDTEHARQTAILEEQKKLAQVVIDNSKVLDKSGQVRPDEDLSRMAAARQGALAKLAELSLQSDTGTAQRLGLVHQLADAMAKQPKSLTADVEGGTANAVKQVQDAFDRYKIRLSFDVSQLENLVGHKIGGQTELVQSFKEAREELAKLQKQQADAGVISQQQIKDLRAGLQTINQMAFEPTWLDKLASTGADKKVSETIDRVRADFLRVSDSARITKEDLLGLVNEVNQLQTLGTTSILGAKPDSRSIDLATKHFAEELSKLQAIRDAQQDQKPFPAASVERMNTLSTFLTTFPIEKLDAGASAAERTAEAAKQIGDHYRSAAENAAQLSAPSQQPVERAAGGSIYFADGGSPRGTDTVPAMLSPGEVVVNASSARKFSGELQAMNAGVAPVYHSHGTTTTIGDINVGPVTINSTSGTQSARTIANGIRRELRRGAATLD